MTVKEYGIKVKEARVTKGLTQTELANQCHMGLRTIQRIEAGHVRPRLQTVKLLNEYLGIQLTDYSVFSSTGINYRSLFYMGLSILGLGVIFIAAVSVPMGAIFIGVGFLNIYIGLRSWK